MQESFRRAVAWIAVISVMSSPLIIAYNFLSSHGYVWQRDANIGIVAVAVNVCCVAGGIAIASCIFTGLPLGFVVAADSGILARFSSPFSLLVFGLISAIRFSRAFADMSGVPILIAVIMGILIGIALLVLAVLSCFRAGIKFVTDRFLIFFMVLSTVSVIIILPIMRKAQIQSMAISTLFWLPGLWP